MAEKDPNTISEADEEFVILEEDPNAAPKDEAPKEDAEDEDEEDDDGEDARLGESEEDSEDEILAKRLKRKKRRELQKRARENAERELRALREANAAMMQRLAAVEGHALSTNEATIEGKLDEARREVQQAEYIIAKAIEAGNGADVAQAMRLRDEAMARAHQLAQAKQQVAEVRQQHAQPQAQSPAGDPRVTNLAQEWMAANPWYKPGSADADTQVVNQIDTQLMREGFNPASLDYWQELTRRVSETFSDEDDAGAPAARQQAPKRKGPPVGSGREHAPKTTRNEIYVTPERKQAMIDAGYWDDPVKRNQMLKAYQSFDRSAR